MPDRSYARSRRHRSVPACPDARRGNRKEVSLRAGPPLRTSPPLRRARRSGRARRVVAGEARPGQATARRGWRIEEPVVAVPADEGRLETRECAQAHACEAAALESRDRRLRHSAPPGELSLRHPGLEPSSSHARPDQSPPELDRDLAVGARTGVEVIDAHILEVGFVEILPDDLRIRVHAVTLAWRGHLAIDPRSTAAHPPLLPHGPSRSHSHDAHRRAGSTADRAHVRI